MMTSLRYLSLKELQKLNIIGLYNFNFEPSVMYGYYIFILSDILDKRLNLICKNPRVEWKAITDCNRLEKDRHEIDLVDSWEA